MTGVSLNVKNQNKWFSAGAISSQRNENGSSFWYIYSLIRVLGLPKSQLLDFILQSTKFRFNFKRKNLQSYDIETVTTQVGFFMQWKIYYLISNQLKLSENWLADKPLLKKTFRSPSIGTNFRIVAGNSFRHYDLWVLIPWHTSNRLTDAQLRHKIHFNVSIWDFYHYSVVKKSVNFNLISLFGWFSTYVFIYESNMAIGEALFACVVHHMKFECIDRRMFFLKQIMRRTQNFRFVCICWLLAWLLEFVSHMILTIDCFLCAAFVVWANCPMRNELNDAIGKKCCLFIVRRDKSYLHTQIELNACARVVCTLKAPS